MACGITDWRRGVTLLTIPRQAVSGDDVRARPRRSSSTGRTTSSGRSRATSVARSRRARHRPGAHDARADRGRAGRLPRPELTRRTRWAQATTRPRTRGRPTDSRTARATPESERRPDRPRLLVERGDPGTTGPRVARASCRRRRADRWASDASSSGDDLGRSDIVDQLKDVPRTRREIDRAARSRSSEAPPRTCGSRSCRGGIYLSPRLDRYVDFHWKRPARPGVPRPRRSGRTRTRSGCEPSTRTALPIPYRVVQETELGPSFAALPRRRADRRLPRPARLGELGVG